MENDKRETKPPSSEDDGRPEAPEQLEPEDDDVAGHLFTGALKEQSPS
jgi:hypothetical protein